jgi:hypothetical protein
MADLIKTSDKTALKGLNASSKISHVKAASAHQEQSFLLSNSRTTGKCCCRTDAKLMAWL